jgi:hypothetical protein
MFKNPHIGVQWRKEERAAAGPYVASVTGTMKGEVLDVNDFA